MKKNTRIAFHAAKKINIAAFIFATINLTAQHAIFTGIRVQSNNTSAKAGATNSLAKKWSVNPFDHQLFIPNNGQFDKELNNGDKAVFSAIAGKTKIYFTAKGVVYKNDGGNILKAGKRHKSGDVSEESEPLPPHYLAAVWQGSSPDVTIDAQDEQVYDYIYANDRNETVKMKVYKKITYHNMYKGIDLVYTFPKDEQGLKYSIVVHPGADISQLKLVYSGNGNMQIDDKGNLTEHSTDEGMSDITDHTPVSFYQDGKKEVAIKYAVNGRTESFVAKNGYDNTRTLVIDPWTTSTSFVSTYNMPYNLDYDNAGNVYVYGGYNPYQLTKLNSAGVFLWTYTATPLNTNLYYGSFVVDKATGTCYVGEGFNTSGAKILKINTAGTLVATFAGNAGLHDIDRMVYSRCSGKILIGGGGGNTNNGQFASIDTSMVTMTITDPYGANTGYHEVDRMCIDPNGNTLYASLSTPNDGSTLATTDNVLMSVPVPALTPYAYKIEPTGDAMLQVGSVSYVANGYNASYYSTFANGMNGMAASPDWLYTYDGYKLNKKNKSTGAVSASTLITAYISNAEGMNETDVYWGGLAADLSDNVYVGANTGTTGYAATLKVYNSSLVLLSSTALPNPSTSVVLGANQATIYVCGGPVNALGLSGSGYVEALASSSPVSVSSTPTFTSCGSCNGTTSVVFSGSAPAGATYSWSPGGQTTQTISGLCAGSYTVNMTMGCTTVYQGSVTVSTSASGSPTVAVSASPSVICAGSTSVITASNGGGTYTWKPAAGLSATTGAAVNATPTVTATYTVYSSTGTCSDSAEVVVTVNASPSVTVKYAGATGAVCRGDTISLEASGATSYTWSPSTFLNATTGAHVIASPTLGITYSVTGASGGCSSTAPVSVIVHPLPNISISPGGGAICQGASITFHDTIGTASSYSWAPTIGLNQTTGSSVIATPTVGTTYTVYGYSAFGCPSFPQSLSVSVTSTPTVTIAPSAPTICPGNNVSITASGATTYTWTPSSTLNASTGATVIATPTATTTYSVTGGKGTCVSSPAQVVVTVAASLNVTVTPSAAAICAGSNVVLNANGAGTYSWKASGGLSCTTCSNPTANPAATTTYTVTGTSGSCKDSAYVAVIVNPVPTTSVTPSGSTTLCSGGSVGLTASGTATSYTWAPATGLNITTGTAVTASPATTQTYTVTGSVASGCNATATVVVTVNPTPTVTATAILSTICAGSSTALNCSGATTYSWSPNTALSATTGSSINASPASTITYSVTGTSAGCNSAVKTVAVTVNPVPTTSVTPSGSTTLCSGGSVGLTASGTATLYTWAPATGLNLTTGMAVTASPATTQTYTVTGSLSTGCNSTATVVVTVNPVPTTSVTPSGATLCSGDFVSLNAGGTATSFTWAPATGLNATTGSSVTANPAVTTTYTVTGTSGSCKNSASVIVTIDTPPAATITGKSTLCSGIADTLTAGGGTGYVWSTGGTNDTIIIDPAFSATYWVSAGSGVCANDTAKLIVTVNSAPVVNVSGHAKHVCGNTDTLIAHASGTRPFAYYWTTGSTDSVAAVITSTTYTVTVTDANTCKTTKNFAVHDSVPVIPICLVTVDSTSSKIIVIWNNPGANTGIDSLFLYRDSVTSNPIARFAVGSYSEFVDTTNGMNPNIHSYQYNLDGVDGCGQGSGGLTGYAKTIHLTISPNGCGYILNWTKYSGYFTFTQYFIHRDSVNMGWKTIDSVNSGTFTWTDANCYSSGTNISYYIDVKDMNACVPSGNAKYTNIVSSRSNSANGTVITGVQQIADENTISIFPNPFTTTTSIVFNTDGTHYLELDDVTGRKIESIECTGKQYELNRNGLAQGIYFIRAYNEGMKYVATAKVVVQ